MHFFTTPKYETRPAFNWARDNQQGFYDIQLNDKYLFFHLAVKLLKQMTFIPKVSLYSTTTANYRNILSLMKTIYY